MLGPLPKRSPRPSGRDERGLPPMDGMRRMSPIALWTAEWSIPAQVSFSLKCGASGKMRVALPNVQAYITQIARNMATGPYRSAL